MTEARVNCGPCGFEAIIRAEADADGCVRLQLSSECPTLQKLAARLVPYDPSADGHTLFGTSVYQAADAVLRHVDCMVPVALIRAAHVEAGLALPHSMTMTVERR